MTSNISLDRHNLQVWLDWATNNAKPRNTESHNSKKLSQHLPTCVGQQN